MRLIIEARLEGAQTGATAAEATIVDVVERQDRSVADLGLTLAEGRALLANVQSILVSQQAAGWMASQVACCRCGSVLAHKDSRSIVMRTVFGKVEVPSPRLWACSCAGKQGEPRRSVSPLCKAVPQRVTPELEYLQPKWAAHLPYRQATELLREVLPLDKAISLGSTRRRILAVGNALDAERWRVRQGCGGQPARQRQDPGLVSHRDEVQGLQRTQCSAARRSSRPSERWSRPRSITPSGWSGTARAENGWLESKR